MTIFWDTLLFSHANIYAEYSRGPQSYPNHLKWWTCHVHYVKSKDVKMADWKGKGGLGKTHSYSSHRGHNLDSAARARHIQTADVLLSGNMTGRTHEWSWHSPYHNWETGQQYEQNNTHAKLTSWRCWMFMVRFGHKQVAKSAFLNLFLLHNKPFTHYRGITRLAVGKHAKSSVHFTRE